MDILKMAAVKDLSELPKEVDLSKDISEEFKLDDVLAFVCMDNYNALIFKIRDDYYKILTFAQVDRIFGRNALDYLRNKGVFTNLLKP